MLIILCRVTAADLTCLGIMASAAPAAAAQSVPLLTARLYDPDSDIRFMSLTDLQSVLQNSQSSSEFKHSR